MGGVLIREGALELSGTNLELRILAPFCIEVYQLNGGLTRTCGVGSLNLGTPVEVANLAIKDETGQTQVEGVRLGIFLVSALILQHAVTAELDVVYPLGYFNRGLLLCIGVQC